MDGFHESVVYSLESALGEMNTKREHLAAMLEHSPSKVVLRGLSTLQLQKAMLAVGAFSMFEASLQNEFGLEDGYAFREASLRLASMGCCQLKDRLVEMQSAINALKHGRGSSYSKLLDRPHELTFRVKMRDEAYFNEGDVGEIQTLVEVDDAFVRAVATLIFEIGEALHTG